jgi:hypothetical protein
MSTFLCTRGAAARFTGMRTNTALELRTYFGKELLDVVHLTKPRDVAVHGEPLLQCEDGAFRLASDLEGAIARGGKVRVLRLVQDDGVLLDETTRAVVERDGMRVAMRFVSAPEKIEGKRLVLDFVFLNVIACVFFAMATAIFCLHLYPYEADAMEELMLQPKIATFIKEPEKTVEQKKAAQEFIDRVNDRLNQKSGGGAPSTTPAAASNTARPQKGKPKVDVNDIGVLRFLKQGTAFGQLTKEDGAIGEDVRLAMNEVSNDRRTASNGSLDAHGDPNALPGPGGDPLKIGRSMERRANDYGANHCLGNDCKKAEHEPVLVEGEVVATGEIPPELIRAVMHENRNAFRYCYERVLQVRHDLAGTVKVQFLIGPMGQVLSATVKDSTIGDKGVEQCLTSRVHALTFPKPRMGGVVIVNYPFVFKAPN